jgi:hypothetical protein
MAASPGIVAEERIDPFLEKSLPLDPVKVGIAALRTPQFAFYVNVSSDSF